MKSCARCNRPRALHEFYKNSRAKDGLQSWCKACAKAQEGTRARRTDYRARQLNRNFKLTLDQYNAMLESQGGKCAICESPTPGKRNSNFSVDHDHACCPGSETCGQCIRGLLCYKCNTALAHFGDNLEGVMKVVSYLAAAEFQTIPNDHTVPSVIGP